MAGRSSTRSTDPVMGFTSAVGGSLSITSNWLPNVVPYFAYSVPATPTLARTAYSRPMRSHHARKVGLSIAMPWPTMATSRPPGANTLSASSTCRAPTILSRPLVLAAREKGGFITTTLGSVLSPLAARAA